MSSVYQPKRKELAKVEVVSSEMYSKNKKGKVTAAPFRLYPEIKAEVTLR